jgi:hypothetical protein
MSLMDLFTWAAIGVLVVGSLVVLAWFLVDARRMLRSMREREP